MDTLFLENLTVSCIIGELPDERTREQTLRLDVRLSCDLSRVCASDDLADTVDYAALAQAIRDRLRAARCRMIEHAARQVADLCLADPRVRAVSVTLRKPDALADACAGVTLTRSA